MTSLINPGRVWLAVLLSLGLLGSGWAQERSAEVFPKANAKLAERLLTSAGYKFSEAGADSYKFKIGTLNVLLLITKDGDFQMYCGFTKANLSLDQMNVWNRDHPFTRAYLDNQGDAVIESDFNMDGAATMANLRDFVSRFEKAVPVFAKLPPSK